jgi:hypothetical protein
MSIQSRIQPKIRNAEDLPKILTTQPRWNSLKECERSVFRSLDITLVTERKVTLLEAMETEVKDIISDAITKGILVRNQDGTVQFNH